MESRDSRLSQAQKAIDSIGLGFDLTQDLCFDNCKRSSRLIVINEEQRRRLEIPSGISIPDVPISIKCVRGESSRVDSGVLSFEQMLRHFNEEMCLGGTSTSGNLCAVNGNFCASFGLSGGNIKDFGGIKCLAYDGWFIKRYTVELERYDEAKLDDHVKEAVPSSWDSEAQARFIEQYGTHVVVGVSMGGKDVLSLRQSHPSNIQPFDPQKLLKNKADARFMGSPQNNTLTSEHICHTNVVVISSRRGGSSEKLSHKEWLESVDLEPDVISMFLLPLTSLLKRIPGGGYVSHAINLYLRCKPPIEDLHKVLEFQLPRHWAPAIKETRLGARWKHHVNSWLRFSFFGPKLYINTIPVDVGNRPVIGLRLQLEGRRSNRLAIQLQHLASLPKSFPLSDDQNAYLSCDSYNCKSHVKVQWNSFSYVCTAPVESVDALSIVTGAQLQVKKKCLSLCLRFSKAIGATSKKSPEWDRSPSLDDVGDKFGGILGQKGQPRPGEKTVGSNTFSATRPVPVKTPKLQRYVDTTEMIRGQEDRPGYWVVAGARLCVKKGKIFLLVKYSLLGLC